MDQDTYRKFILPALAVAETIATRGKSPGTLALGQEQIFQGAEDSRLKKQQIEAQIAEQRQVAQQRALEGQLTPYQVAAAQRNQKQGMEEDAAISALQSQLGIDSTLNDTERAYYKYNPKAYGEKLKPAPTQLMVDGSGTVVPVLRTTGKTPDGKSVTPPPPASQKSIAEIEAEAAARAKGALEGAGDKPMSGDAAKLSGYVSTLVTQGGLLKKMITDKGIRWVTMEYKKGNPAVVNVIEDAADAKGRLRSGGAVNDQEAARFKQPFTGLGNVVYGDNDAAVAAIDQILAEAAKVQGGMGKGSAPGGGDVAVGSTKTNKDGDTVRWNGTGWELAH